MKLQIITKTIMEVRLGKAILYFRGHSQGGLIHKDALVEGCAKAHECDSVFWKLQVASLQTICIVQILLIKHSLWHTKDSKISPVGGEELLACQGV